MRNPSISTVQFSVGNPGEFRSLDEAVRYIQQLEQRVANALTLLAAGHLDATYVAPEKPRDGDFRHASGPGGWDPGSGKGFYRYDGVGALWVFIG